MVKLSNSIGNFLKNRGFKLLDLPVSDFVYGKVVYHGDKPFSLRISTGVNKKTNEDSSLFLHLALYVRQDGVPRNIGRHVKIKKEYGWRIKLEESIKNWEQQL